MMAVDATTKSMAPVWVSCTISVCGAQQLAGVHLHAVLVAQLLVDVVGKGFQSQMIRVGLGLHMADAHDLAVVTGAGAAAGKHRAAGQCRCAHQRQKRSSLS